MIFLCIAAAAAILLWPTAKKAVPTFAPPAPVPEPEPAEPWQPTFLDATVSLAAVRRRLIHTSLLAESEKKAVDILQLALTAGSDKE